MPVGFWGAVFERARVAGEQEVRAVDEGFGSLGKERGGRIGIGERGGEGNVSCNEAGGGVGGGGGCHLGFGGVETWAEGIICNFLE